MGERTNIFKVEAKIMVNEIKEKAQITERKKLHVNQYTQFSEQ